MGRNTNNDELETQRNAESTEDIEQRSETEIEGVEAGSGDEGGEGEGEDDGGEGDVPSGAPKGFKKRIAKLTAQRNAERKEREALAARLAAFEAKERKAEEDRRATEAATPEGLKASERRKAIREAIDEAYGPGTSDFIEREKTESVQERNARREEYALKGVSYLQNELEDHGIDVTDERLVRWERAIGSELQEDAALHAMFLKPATQKDAIAEAFKRVRDGLANPAIEQQGGKPLARIERNRSAVLGSGRGPNGGTEGIPIPDGYVAKPPKDLTGEALTAWWKNHGENMWEKLRTAGA